MQFVRLFSLCIVKLRMLAMEDRLISRLGLAVGLRMSHSSEPYLAAQVVEIVRELTSVELPAIIKNNGARNTEAGDNVSPNKPSYFSSGYRGYGFGLYPFGEVVDRNKKALAP